MVKCKTRDKTNRITAGAVSRKIKKDLNLCTICSDTLHIIILWGKLFCSVRLGLVDPSAIEVTLQLHVQHQFLELENSKSSSYLKHGNDWSPGRLVNLSL